MGDGLDLCAECDVPIPARRPGVYPGERERFCGPCGKWRARNLIPFPRMDQDGPGCTESVVRSETLAFYRRNCVEV